MGIIIIIQKGAYNRIHIEQKSFNSTRWNFQRQESYTSTNIFNIEYVEYHFQYRICQISFFNIGYVIYHFQCQLQISYIPIIISYIPTIISYRFQWDVLCFSNPIPQVANLMYLYFLLANSISEVDTIWNVGNYVLDTWLEIYNEDSFQ